MRYVILVLLLAAVMLAAVMLAAGCGGNDGGSEIPRLPSG
jgi:hypothetical protein